MPSSEFAPYKLNIIKVCGTEKILYDALLTLMQGRTSFVNAHRLGTIRKADEILVVKNGEIIEHGRREDLLALDGFYNQLYRGQFKWQMVTL
jgi:ATP-binding cassette, subfamily B, multidrug efflux pump